MDLTQYVKDATSTESLIETVKVDPQLLASTLQIMIAAGTILDQIKKNVFYEKPYNIDNIMVEFSNMVESLDGIKTAILTGIEPQDTLYTPRIFHSIVGIATESIELLEGMTDDTFDTVNFLEELGDLNWYEAIGIDAVSGDFDNVLTTNIEKLRARYPDKFNKDAAVDRDLTMERDLLDLCLNSDDGC